MFKVLSIDGGGIRGVIPGVLLEHIEAECGKKIWEIFDLIVGTSTGGILAAGLTVPTQKGSKKPKFGAADMVALYKDHGGEIFERSLWRKLTSAGGTLDESYSHENLEKHLKDRLGNLTLADTLKPVVLTAYDIERREPYFFKSSKAKNAKRNHYLRDAARATSAAPTYFEPAEVLSLSNPKVRRVLVDGGIFVNNPAMCAYSEAFELNKKKEDVLLVSLGTGVATRPILMEEAESWGVLGWAKPVISAMMDGSADAADFHLRQLLPDENNGVGQRYFRFDIPLEYASDDMDDASKGNISNLEGEAERIKNKQSEEFRRLIQKIKK